MGGQTERQSDIQMARVRNGFKKRQIEKETETNIYTEKERWTHG